MSIKNKKLTRKPNCSPQFSLFYNYSHVYIFKIEQNKYKHFYKES